MRCLGPASQEHLEVMAKDPLLLLEDRRLRITAEVLLLPLVDMVRPLDLLLHHMEDRPLHHRRMDLHLLSVSILEGTHLRTHRPTARKRRVSLLLDLRSPKARVQVVTAVVRLLSLAQGPPSLVPRLASPVLNNTIISNTIMAITSTTTDTDKAAQASQEQLLDSLEVLKDSVERRLLSLVRLGSLVPMRIRGMHPRSSRDRATVIMEEVTLVVDGKP